jgi:hypothetical protein
MLVSSKGIEKGTTDSDCLTLLLATGYWTDTSFADFLLATLYSSTERLQQAKVLLAKEP